MSRLPLGTNGQVLTVNSVTSQPVWGGLPLLTSVYSTVQAGSGAWTTAGNHITVPVLTKTSTYSMASTDQGKLILFGSGTASGQKLNLLAAPANGSVATRVKNESSNVVQLSGSVNGSSYFNLSGGIGVTIVSDGSTWHTC